MEAQIKTSPSDYAAIYARKSIKTENHSIDTQIAIAKDALFKHKLLLYETYHDSESATKFHFSQRPGFNRLIQDATKGKFKTLIVYRRDRLARKYKEFLEIKKIFQKYNIKIIYTNDVNFSNSDDYISGFVENIVVGVAELEAKIVSERTAMGRKKKKESGEYSTAITPYGYKKEPHENVTYYTLDKNKKEIIKSIFEKYMYLNNDCTKQDLLNEINSNIENKKDKLSSIDNIIKNPIYTGLMFKDECGIMDLFDKNNNTLIADADNLFIPCFNVEYAVDKDTWYNAITKWRSTYTPRTRRRKTYLFKGILSCDICGKNINLASNRYGCRSKECTSINEDILIPRLLNEILDHILTPDKSTNYIKSKIKELEQMLSNKKRELKLKKDEKKTILLRYIQNSSDVNNQNTLKSLLDYEDGLNEQINRYTKEIDHYMQIIKNIDKINTLGTKEEIFKKLKQDIDYSQNLLSEIIKKVTIHGNDASYEIENIKYEYDNK